MMRHDSPGYPPCRLRPTADDEAMNPIDAVLDLERGTITDSFGLTYGFT
jgi:hypothetical protein